MPFPRFAALFAGLLTLTFATAADDAPVEIKLDKKGKIKAPAPAGWKSEKPANTLRSYQFRIPSGEEGGGDAEFIVMPNSSPVADKSFPRWRTSFVVPEGTAADDIGKVSKLDLPIGVGHVLDVTGTWKFKERPFDPKSKEEMRPDYRVIWVILVDKNDEATHFRLSGPAKVVAKHQKEMEDVLKALK